MVMVVEGVVLIVVDGVSVVEEEEVTAVVDVGDEVVGSEVVIGSGVVVPGGSVVVEFPVSQEHLKDAIWLSQSCQGIKTAFRFLRVS